MCTTCSKRSHKSVLGLYSTLRNFLSMKTGFQFHLHNLLDLQLPNQAELAQAPIVKVVVHMSMSNFVNYTRAWIIMDCEFEARQVTLSGSIGFTKTRLQCRSATERECRMALPTAAEAEPPPHHCCQASRHRLAHSPPQNRRLQLTHSSAVSSSTSSTFQLSQTSHR